ncbi:hypothetical protein E5S67_06391 [Microcoleus sp. IPMA8]|uniref:Uncharacterized protein n=1 Tax=Microcoleus asticus IPMA8 TaxID=2563858 RepID=A0ABX2D7G8_9CYAN|nr:hypothetical protein [Microcoleus asticus IPMA8]
MVVFFLGKWYCIFDGGRNSNADGVTIVPALCYEIRARQQSLIYIFLIAELLGVILVVVRLD